MSEHEASIANGLKSPGRVAKRAGLWSTIMASCAALLILNGGTGPSYAMDIDRAAPVISSDEILINAPIDIIWSVQTNISNWPQWRPTVPAAHWEGELKVGSAFRWEEGGLKIVSTVREIVPERRIVWTGPAQGIDAVHAWTFTPTEHGVLVRTEESWNGEAVRGMEPTLQPILDGALKDWLMRLKAKSESVGGSHVAG